MDKATYEKLVSGELTIEQLRRQHPPGNPWCTELLEAKLLEAEAVIVMAQEAVGVDHPAWVILDDYDGSMDCLKDLVAENAFLREAFATRRAALAQLIRDELVCCDIYQRLEDLCTADGKPTDAWRTLRHSHEYHDICFYSEWSARIVEKGPRGD